MKITLFLGQALGSLVWRAGPAMLAAFVLVGSWSGIQRIFLGKTAVRWKAVAGVFCVLALFQYVREWLGWVSEVVDPGDFLSLTDPSAWDLFYDVPNGVVFAPVFEELMFRGILFMGTMKRLGAPLAALLSTVCFAVIHTQYDAWGMFSVGVFGLGCCWLTWKTGSIKSSIVLHMIYNGLITLYVYAFYQMPIS